MKKTLISFGLLILLFQPSSLRAIDRKNDNKKKEYISLQLYFVDYYSNWSYFRFKVYNEYYQEYSWQYDEEGLAGGYLELNIGICWKHFFSQRIFGELSLTTGLNSLEKSKIYRYVTEKFTEIRIRPLEYIAQAGLGYCFFQSERVYIFGEVSGSLNLSRSWPSDVTAEPERARNPNFSWRGELGIIFHLPKNSFFEIEVGLFHNSNYYHNNGHQVRVGIGKTF